MIQPRPTPSPAFRRAVNDLLTNLGLLGWQTLAVNWTATYAAATIDRQNVRRIVTCRWTQGLHSRLVAALYLNDARDMTPGDVLAALA